MHFVAKQRHNRLDSRDKLKVFLLFVHMWRRFLLTKAVSSSFSNLSISVEMHFKLVKKNILKII